MRWNVRVAGLSVAAALLIVPLAAQAGRRARRRCTAARSSADDDGLGPGQPPRGAGRDDLRSQRAGREGATEVEAEATGEGERRARDAACRRLRRLRRRRRRRSPARCLVRPDRRRGRPGELARRAARPVARRPPARAAELHRGGRAVASRGIRRVCGDRQPRPVTSSSHSGKASRGLIAGLAAAAFAEALLITRMLRRRRLEGREGT